MLVVLDTILLGLLLMHLVQLLVLNFKPQPQQQQSQQQHPSLQLLAGDQLVILLEWKNANLLLTLLVMMLLHTPLKMIVVLVNSEVLVQSFLQLLASTLPVGLPKHVDTLLTLQFVLVDGMLMLMKVLVVLLLVAQLEHQEVLMAAH